MQTRTFTARFVTPAFIGNVEQAAQWRTPPFKALLRQWWRVAVARDYEYDHRRLREAEGKLFGHAWLENDRDERGRPVHARSSKVRIRLGQWRPGGMRNWERDTPVHHPEVGAGGRKVGAHLYLGYGPMAYRNGGTRLKAKASIQAEEQTEFRIAWPEDEANIRVALQLMHWFGGIGGRCRNGWGSLVFDDAGLEGLEGLKQSQALLGNLARSIGDCLGRDWPHALGKDEDGRLLIWCSRQAYGDWREAMVELAKTKIDFRTALSFDDQRLAGRRVDRRQLLAYPVTHHAVRRWGPQARLANQLRFKVTKSSEGKYVPLAFHLPCALPEELLNALDRADRQWINGQQRQVWRTVHGVIDSHMQRIS